MKIISKFKGLFSENEAETHKVDTLLVNSQISPLAKLYPPYKVSDSSIGDYTYIVVNSNVSMTQIGKFCSIGPNFISGWGIHPTNMLSTSPMFYSTKAQNGTSLASIDKVVERQTITIGNDVFIGLNVVILDGVTVGHGAVIAAGAVVVEDVEPYTIVGGIPAKLIKKRFTDEEISALCAIKWWDWEQQDLEKVEKGMCNPKEFIDQYGIK